MRSHNYRSFSVKKTLLAVVSIAMLAATLGRASAADAPVARDRSAILATMSAYEKALNASDTAAVLPLYTEDGVFMPPYSQSAVGKAAVRQAYDAVFKAIKLTVKFNYAEVVEMAPQWAYVRTTSAGHTTLNASGKQSAEGNQELFILHKESDGKWKIARYSFSSTNPPPGQ
jgi:uncharacterized protein (TIGR02246 family)